MYRVNKLVRSLLFTPADRKSALEKAWANRALDVMVIDLEDAVAGTAESKALGRQNLAAFLQERGEVKEGDVRPNVVVRINCPNTSAFGQADLLLLQGMSGLDAVLLPKAHSAASIAAVASQLQKPVWCMVETPRGVQQADALAAMDEVDCLVFGSNDLTKDLQATLVPVDRTPLLYSMSRVVLAARAAGKLVMDGVHMDLRASPEAEAALEQECLQGKQLGFDGKSLIHPKQVATCNRVFSPMDSEVAYAEHVIAAYSAALVEGKGVCLLQGKLLEQLHVDAARALLVRHSLIQKRACHSK